MSAGERKLAAIMFTDIVGYTALAQKDEALAIQILFENNRLLRPIFSKHGGREVKVMGDSFLVEFSSALEAVRCGIAIQLSLRDRNAGLSRKSRIDLRIGIHLGDIILRDGDIFGDAVNVASRIQPEAEPGGICISGQVYDHVRNKIELPLVEMKNQPLKNVSIPIDLYKVVMPWSEEKPAGSGISDKMRIAVLPFRNLSPDPGDEYFADGMTEELITVLSTVRRLSVIARTSVMQYKNVSKRASEIGRELSAGTLVEGSVRKAGNKVRLAVQLVDARGEGHIWANSYDEELGDIFAVQTDIAKRISRSLKVKLLSEGTKSIERKPVRSEAYVMYLKGVHFRNKVSEEGWRRAVEFLEKAREMDPLYADATAALSVCYDWLAYFAFENPSKAYSRAKELALEALRISDSVAEAHLSLFFVSFYHEGDWGRAETEIKRALELNPSSAEAHNNYAFYLANFGRTEEAKREAETALELDPLSVMSHVITADVYAWVGRYDRAISKFKAALEIDPDLPIAHNDMGLAYLAMGRTEDGAKELERACKLSRSSPFFQANLGYAYGVCGKRDEARTIATELKQTYSKGLLPAYFLAVVFAGLGEKEEALGWLEKAYEEHAIIFVPLLSVEPALATLREEPRFRALLAHLALPR